MKHLIIALIAAVLAVALCACGANRASGNADVADSPAVSSQADADAGTDEPEQNSSQRDALMTYQVQINGVSLTVPFEYSELTALGYSLPEDDELAANTYTIGTYVKNADGDSLHIQFWNGSTETKKYSECQVCQIEITLDNQLDVKLPGNITFDENLTPEQIIAAYGEPDFDNDQEDYRSLHYENGGFESVKFMLNKEDEMKHYNSLTINHIEN